MNPNKNLSTKHTHKTKDRIIYGLPLSQYRKWGISWKRC